MATTVMCLFREPLPAGEVYVPTAGVTEVRVEDDRRVAEITIKKPETSWAAKTKETVGSWFRADAKLGNLKLVLPAGEFSSRRHTGLGPHSSARNSLTDRTQRCAVNITRVYAVAVVTEISSTPHVSGDTFDCANKVSKILCPTPAPPPAPIISHRCGEREHFD
jgi:hypothetical protein